MTGIEVDMNSDVVAGLVSVVIPTYNRADYLPRAVFSVLAQTYSAVEAIVIDDGSQDETGDVVAAQFGGDSRVRYVRQENTGVSGARNHGLRLASGEFVALLDSDDAWFPWKLETQLAVLRAFPEAGMVWSDMQAIDPRGRVSHDRYLKTMYSAYHWFTERELFDQSLSLPELGSALPEGAKFARAFCGDLYSPMIMGNLVHTSTVVLRRERLRRVGEFVSKYQQGGEDYHFHLRTCREGRVAFLDMPTIQYQLGLSDQITRPGSQIHFATSFLDILQTELAEHREQIQLPAHLLREVQAEAHAWLAGVALERADLALARRESWLSLCHKPWQPSVWRTLLLALMPTPLRNLLRSVRRGLRSLGNPSIGNKHA